MLLFVLVIFRAFPVSGGNSLRHGCDMDRLGSKLVHSRISSTMLVRLHTRLVICNESGHRNCRTAERQKMASKQVTLAVGAVLFTAINLLVLAANWSITAHAKVAGRDYSVDADFRR